MHSIIFYKIRYIKTFMKSGRMSIAYVIYGRYRQIRQSDSLVEGTISERQSDRMKLVIFLIIL